MIQNPVGFKLFIRYNSSNWRASNSSLRGGVKHMKILIKNLRRILLVQLFIVGATLSITATNAGAAALPCAVPDTASEEG